VTEIREASDGQEAVHLVEESCPDIVLMDVHMPEMDGLQATRLIKTKWPQVPVILLSMYAEFLDDAAVAGADAFFVKGDSPQQLLALLSAVIQ
jgi:CheY-like chemotaxis protein